MRRKRARRGALMVEAVFVIGSLLILMFAIFEYGRFTMIKHAVDNAAREGTRLALAANASDSNSFNYQTIATIQTTVVNALGGQDAALNGPPLVQVYLADSAGTNIGNWSDAQVGQNIAVQVNASYSPILPTFGFLPANIPIFAKCVMRSDAN